ncbi:PadR family transcriptional regulator [Parafrigoribacterium soli]|uniref:PadR family transcriptional regulator n=1 Tax=Parafrigoribacterium soli TaxID=3144663 RepID=UPI0032EE6ADA
MGSREATALGIATLALLAERPMHPYEMYQTFVQRRQDRVVKLRRGSLYHCVYWLEDHGMVRSGATEREGNRPERTVYEITAGGREKLTQQVARMLATPVNEYPAFPLAIGEAHNLPLDIVIELLDTRLGLVKGQLAESEDAVSHLETRELDRRYWLDVSYTRAIQAAEVSWLEQLLADLRTNVIPWPENGQPKHTKAKEHNADA